jgi:uncharacterized protein YkwD
LGHTATNVSALPTTATTADLAFCVSEVNRYRAMAGVPALTQSSTIEAYAAEGAQQDGTAHAAHQHVTQSPPTRTWGENEIIWWPIVIHESIQAVIKAGFAQMWAEGPNGDHYQNIVSTRYTETGCGVYVANGEITVTQDFQ